MIARWEEVVIRFQICIFDTLNTASMVFVYNKSRL